jgi:hypothetical protein
MEDKPK